MKIIGQGKYGVLIVEMKEDELAQAAGFRCSGHSFTSTLPAFKVGAVIDFSAMYNNANRAISLLSDLEQNVKNLTNYVDGFRALLESRKEVIAGVKE